MPNRIAIVAVILILLGLTACGQKQTEPAKQRLIITTIEPYRIITSQLLGKQFTVQNLIPANASPHTWTPLPSDLKAVHNAELIISNGFDLEANLENLFTDNAAKHIQIGTLIDLPKHADHDEHPEAEHAHSEAKPETEAEHHHHGTDPHLWTSPELMTRIVLGLANELIRRYPGLESNIRSNADLMVKDLKIVQAKIIQERAKYATPAIITFHNSFDYFNDEFNIDCVGYIQASPGKEPLPREMYALGKQIKAKQIKAIFIEPQMNPAPARTLATELGLKLILIDPLGATKHFTSIVDYYNYIWSTMSSGF